MASQTTRTVQILDAVLGNDQLEPSLRRQLTAGRSVMERVSKRELNTRTLSIPKAEATTRSTSDPSQHAHSSTPKLSESKRNSFTSRPLEIVWRHPCRGRVSVYGTFTEQPWTEVKMTREIQDGFFKLDLSDWGLSPGTYIFKFVVDGEWRIDPTLPTRQDLNGHINNTMFVRSSTRPLKTVRSAPMVEASSSANQTSRAGTPQLQLPRGSTTLHRTPSITPQQFFAREYDSSLSCDRQSTNLRLICGGWMIPHPEKSVAGGADSFFFTTSAAGVADGVGEWEWRFKLDPRKFAEQLMKGCLLASNRQKTTPCNSSTEVEHKAQSVLSEGFEAARAFGSSTACIFTLDSCGERIGVANLGDSGLIHFRKQFLTGALSMTCVMRTREQQHGFNTPYQLSRIPDPAHYDEIAQDPLYIELIQSLRSLSGRQLSKIDKPTDCELYSSRLKEGDLLLLATDGALDNLWNYDLLSVVGEAAVVSPFDCRMHQIDGGPTDPEQIAKAVALAAYEKSILTGGYKSPFGVECRKRTGQVHLGGKMDDITVVACWVAREEDTESVIKQISKKKQTVYDGESTCRDWWKAQRGKARNTSADDVRRASRYERFMSNEPLV
jgi:serine/threonine protein phosphatase PrpC